jgi:hypothetical protein
MNGNNPFGTRSFFHDDHRKGQDKKELRIRHLSTSADETSYLLQFEITTQNLKDIHARIFVVEKELIKDEIAVPSTSIKLPSTGVKIQMLSFSKSKSFSKSVFEGEFEFQATVVCDGLSAATNEFSLKLEKVQKIVNEPKAQCFCRRDFTVEELKLIIRKLREANSDVISKFKLELFTASNCKIPREQATYDHFTDELNLTLFNYGIDTCIRKIHFLAQSSLESEIFTTAQEKGSISYLKSKSYYPFIGRGIIQITHSGEERGTKGYKQYFEYLNRDDYKTNYNELNENLHLAIDVGGYFWKRGKILSRDFYVPKYPRPDAANKRYSTHKLANHYTIDLSVIADDDNVKEITYLINGGLYHLAEREKFTILLKELLNYENCANK